MKLKKYMYGRIELTLFTYKHKKQDWQEVKRSWWGGKSFCFSKGKFSYYLEFLTYKKWPQAFIFTRRNPKTEKEKTFALYLFNSI
jgi:hypothetical protein